MGTNFFSQGNNVSFSRRKGYFYHFDETESKEICYGILTSFNNPLR